MPFLRALAAALFALAVLAATPGRAGEADVAEILSRFTLDRFPDTIRAVEDLAATGHEHAGATIEALGDRRLGWRASDRRLIWREPDGNWRDALSGEQVAAPEPAGLKTVRVNNAVRRAIETALGGLQLMSRDPRTRIAAAETVFRTRNLSALPSLMRGLERETHPGAREAFLRAAAALTFLSPEAPEEDRVAAVSVLAERGDLEAQAMLRNLPADAPERVRRAAAERIAEIESHLALIGVAQDVFYGLSLGSVLLLAAIGLAITFGVMGVINMAHGEMVMIGAYVTFVVQEVIRTSAPHLFDLSLFLALPLAFLVAGAIGVAIERSVIRFLYGRPLETLLATWGVSLILQQAVRSLFGPTNREVGAPSFMAGSVEILGLSLTTNRVVIIGFSLAVFVGLLLVMKLTPFGLRMRAVVQNRRMAASMGIRTPYIDALTFGLGSGIAGIAGVALSQIDNVSPNLGQAYIIDSFMVVVFGGVGNLFGTLVAALTLGVANKLLEPFAGAVLAKIFVLVFIILFIQKRPRGLFALKGRAVEA